MDRINNPVSDYKVSSSGIKPEQVQNTLSKSTQAVSDNFESNSLSKALIGNMSDPRNFIKTVSVIIPLYIVDKFVDGLIGKTAGDGLLQKAAGFGDWISHTLHLDNIISEQNGSRISNFLKKNQFTKYFTEEYKAIPKSSLAKGMKLSDKYKNELFNAIQKFANSERAIEVLNNSGAELSQETISILKKTANGNVTDVSSKSLVQVADELIHNGINKFDFGGIDGKKCFSELKNKFLAANNQTGKTSIGKFMAKSTLKTKDLLNFGGGILGLYFAANGIINSVKAAKEAPKGEKKATFMHVLSEQYLGILLFQPSINLMYKLGGNKYRGMTVDARNALKELITKTNADETITKEGIKIAKMQRDLLLKGVNKEEVAKLAGQGLKEAKNSFKMLKKTGAKLPLWEQALKLMGTIMDVGLDEIKKLKVIKLPFKLPFIGNVIKTSKPTFKGFAGGLGRLLIILMVLQPILQKPVTKLFHKIFGEPKTYLKKQEANNDTKDKKANENTSNSQIDNSKGETNLLKIYSQQESKTEENTGYIKHTVESKEDNTEEIPALNLFKKNDENKRRYIPSIEVDNSYAQKREKEIEKEVDSYIKQQNKTLKKKYGI